MLICASDDRTCAQLQQYIRRGAERLLNGLYARTIAKQHPSAASAIEWAKPKKDKGGSKGKGRGKEMKKKTSKAKSGPSLTLTQMVGKEQTFETAVMGSSEDEDDFGDEDQMAEEDALKLDLSSDAYYAVLKEPLMVIHPLRGCTDPHSLTRVLHEVEPTFVVLYDAEVSFVRQLELYKACRPGKPLRCVCNLFTSSKEGVFVFFVFFLTCNIHVGGYYCIQSKTSYFSLSHYSKCSLLMLIFMTITCTEEYTWI